MCYYEAKQTINDIFSLQKGKKMKQNRVEAVLKNMEDKAELIELNQKLNHIKRA